MLSERVDSSQIQELASKGAEMALRLSVVDLARLLSCTLSSGFGQDDDQAELAVAVQFDIGPEEFPRVELLITGGLQLQCQRCLEPLMWPVRIETRLTLLDSDVQTELLSSPIDSVLTGADGLNLVAVIEDEILAALPMVPVHSNESPCRPSGGNDSLVMDAELTQKPFADLASLMGSRNRNADN